MHMRLMRHQDRGNPELAAQEAKQARKQAKRARQRARRAQGAAADADGKVCSSLWLCVSTPCLVRLKGCIPMWTTRTSSADSCA